MGRSGIPALMLEWVALEFEECIDEGVYVDCNGGTPSGM